MSKKCSGEVCTNTVQWVCECKVNNYFCTDHLNSHFKKFGRHGLDSLFIEPDEDQKTKILMQMNEKLKRFKIIEDEWRNSATNMIANIIQHSKEIQNIISEAKFYLRSIIKIFLTNGEIEREEYEKGFELDSDYFVEIIKQIRIELSGVFDKFSKKIDFSQKNYQYRDDEDLFFILSNQLVKINLTTMKKVIQSVQYPQANCQSSCKLRDGKFFIQENNSTNCYVADLANNILTKLANSPVSMAYGFAGCLDDSLYLICQNGVNEKFDLQSQQWGKVAKLPSTGGNSTIGGAINNKICISIVVPNAMPHIYDPLTDTYKNIQNIPGSLYAIGYGFILSSQTVFKVVDNNELSWTSIPFGSNDRLPCFCWNNQYIFKRNEFLYVLPCNQALYRFNTKTYSLETVSFS